jgi:isopenicillin N synthase-like dioxygenase
MVDDGPVAADTGPTKDDLIASFRVGSQGGGRRLFVVGRAAEAAEPVAEPVLEEPIDIADLLSTSGGERAREVGAAFCARLKRDGFAQLRLPADGSEAVALAEESASRWFAQPADAKLASAGPYGPASGTLAGYANGRDREQLEIRLTVQDGRLYPNIRHDRSPVSVGSSVGFVGGEALAPLLTRLMRMLDSWARALLAHVAADLGVHPTSFFDAMLDPAFPRKSDDTSAAAAAGPCETTPEGHTPLAATADLSSAAGIEPGSPPPAARLDPGTAHAGCPALRHAGLRVCRYTSDAPGCVALEDGRRVLCAEHNDVGLLTLDAEASVPGLQAFHKAQRQWVSLEGSSLRGSHGNSGSPVAADGLLSPRLLTVMVGDTLAALTGGSYTSCRHRVLAPEPPVGHVAAERIGLPYLFRCRGDATIDTREERRRAQAQGRAVTLAELLPTTVDDLPTADCPQALANYMAWRRKYRK